MDYADDPFRSFDSSDETGNHHTQEDRTPILPVPSDAPELQQAYVEACARPGFSLAQVWTYRSLRGELLMRVARYDRPASGAAAEKDVRPFTFGLGRDGVRRWKNKAIPSHRPLYRLDELAKRPAAPVLVVEGEKTADAAAKRFPGYVVVTSSGGSNAAAKTDWSPLKRRTVTIWPDADEPGHAYANEVVGLLLEAGASVFALSWCPRHSRPAGIWRTSCPPVSATPISKRCWLQHRMSAPNPAAGRTRM
jgi:hypothetical protein